MTEKEYQVSLFDDKRFQYRDTFFVFFNSKDAPGPDAVRQSLEELDEGFVVSGVRGNSDGIESFSIRCPEDHSAMDVSRIEGEEVTSQIRQLLQDFKNVTLVGDDSKRIGKLAGFDSRFDILHFEQAGSGEDLDPGGLLLVIQQLSRLSNGVGIDPQSLSLL